VTTPGRRLAGALRDDRLRGGRAGVLARRSASSSREQIGQFAVRRLWRQKSDIALAA
jgi:hypothetical protein